MLKAGIPEIEIYSRQATLSIPSLRACVQSICMLPNYFRFLSDIIKDSDLI